MQQRFHFGVYAIVYEQSSRSLVLIKKSRGPYINLYDLPGGRPEEGETLDSALIREVLEETGLQIDQLEEIAFIKRDFVASDEAFHHQGVIYNVTTSGSLLFEEFEDSLGAFRICIDALDQNQLTPFAQYALEYVK